jgi:hypothetical protein
MWPYPVLFVLVVFQWQPSLSAQLIPSADGLTTYDTHLQARWLLDANLAGTPYGQAVAADAGLTIPPSGSMDYNTALQWLGVLNSGSFGAPAVIGLLGHTTWTLPTSPLDPVHGFPPPDPGCTSHGPGGGGFGFACTDADMAGLFNLPTSLNLHWPNTAVPIPDTSVGPFHHFQPYLYWGKQHTFSFNTGWTGSNTNEHYMYVLPRVPGRAKEYGQSVIYTPTGKGSLEASPDGQLVYDPGANVTWLANANLATSQTFGAQCASYVAVRPAVFPRGIPCIARDGSMAYNTAQAWITGMKTYNNGPGLPAGWLGIQNWDVPGDGPGGGCGGFSCTSSEMGELYYLQLRVPLGTPVVPTPVMHVGPFYDIQPYLYWSCGAPVTTPPCQTPPPQVPTQAWSFSFGNGFQGTDLQVNYFYVMIYFPQTLQEALADAITLDLATRPRLRSEFVSYAAAIFSAQSARTNAREIRAFVHHVRAQHGKALSVAEANELIALAEAASIGPSPPPPPPPPPCKLGTKCS